MCHVSVASCRFTILSHLDAPQFFCSGISNLAATPRARRLDMGIGGWGAPATLHH